MTKRIYQSLARGPILVWLPPAACLWLAIATLGCGDAPATPFVGSSQPNSAAAPAAKATPIRLTSRRQLKFPRHLSEFQLFHGEIARLDPAAGVVEYDVNSPSFSDYAVRQRVVRLPQGTSATYDATGPFEFPFGTIIAKTFYHVFDMTDPAQGRRLIETRILLHRQSGWIGLPYVWNDEQTEATLAVAGAAVEVEWIHKGGEPRRYTRIVPNVNDCKRCHQNESMQPIGLAARHINRDFAYDHGSENQLSLWTRTGMLKGAPDPDDAPRLAVWNDPATGTLDERARAWLDINCAHCHNPRGPARNSGLYLNSSITDPYQLGVFKTPVAAGRGTGGRLYDLVPGEPDASIMLFRIESTDAGAMMPEFGRSLVDEEGVALIRQWIAEMEDLDYSG